MVPLISLKNVSIEAEAQRRWFRYSLHEEKPVDDVSFDIELGKCFGLFGGEGNGKLPISFSILGLHRISSGKILYEGTEISNLSRKRYHPLRKWIQAIFWDSFGQMNPGLSLDQAFRQVIRVWYPTDNKFEILSRIEAVMDLVKLPASNRYLTPLELDPAERQLAALARALLPEPKFLIAHEVTRGLDVIEQAEVLNRILDVKDARGLSVLLMTDNLAVAEHMSDNIGVLHRGRLVETGATEKIMKHPEHDYTHRLVSATTAYSSS